MSIYTHFNVDLDAVASTWTWQCLVDPSTEPIEFRPANWDGSGMSESDVALDIDAGGRGIKGRKGANGVVHSCFAGLVSEYCSEEDQLALRELVAFVDAQDRGNAVKNLGVTDEEAVKVLSFTSLNAVLRGFQTLYPRDDQAVCDRMFEVLDGLLQAGRRRAQAEQEADGAEWVTPEVTIIRNARSMGANGALMERGARVVVFVDGSNLGVVRRDDVLVRMDHPAIREAVAGEEGWFFHPAGFLAARGTRKAPANTPSRIDPRSLAQAAVKALEE